jgi:hypothetical protein
MSTQGDSTLPTFSLIDSPLDESSWNDCLTCDDNEGRLMVTFINIIKVVMVDDTDNKIKYIKTNPVNQEGTSMIRVKQDDQDHQPLLIDLLDSSKDKISGNELDDMEGEEEGEGKEELPGMPEHKGDRDMGMMPVSNFPP